jgi:hypothetical protein
MPTDTHGVTHAGSLGLFDDVDETFAAAARSERHERENLESAICRHERRAGRQYRKAAKTPWHTSFFGKLFGGHKDHNTEQVSVEGGLVEVKDSSDEESDNDGFEIVRRPEMPEKIYSAEDIDPVNSPWLRECGMVRVRSDDAGGCHIVPKSRIGKDD